MARQLIKLTDVQKREVELMAGYGIPQEDIARALGVSAPTLRRECKEQLAIGAIKANAKVARYLFVGIVGDPDDPDGKRGAIADEKARVTAAIFWLKTRAHWKETSVHEHTGIVELEEVTTVRERITRRIARIAAARTAGSDPPDDT